MMKTKKIKSINQSKSRETEWKIRGEEKIEKNFILSEREKKTKKRKMLRDLNRTGNRNSTHCKEDTPYEEVEDECNVYIEDKGNE